VRRGRRSAAERRQLSRFPRQRTRMRRGRSASEPSLSIASTSVNFDACLRSVQPKVAFFVPAETAGDQRPRPPALRPPSHGRV
jgi:hypothetical protein